MEIVKKEVAIPVEEGKISALFCVSGDTGLMPAVVIFHGSDGFNPNHQKVAENLAREGLAVLTPTWFGGSSSRSHWDKIRSEDLLQFGVWLKNQPTIHPKRVGAVGFSRGGGLALIFSSLVQETRAVVNYFGLTSWAGGLEEFPHLRLNREDPLDFVKRVPCPILSFHGDQDTVVPLENVNNLDRVCRRFGVEHDFVIYPGVNHSFVWPGDKYNESAHMDSWERALTFLKINLIN